MPSRPPQYAHSLPSWTRKRSLISVAIAAVASLLGGCLDQRPPLLEVSPTEELQMTATNSSVVVHNLGGQVLEWSVASDDPRVTTTPAGGRIFATGSMTVRIDIDSSAVDKSEVLTATLTFSSNGGDDETLVRFSPESGIGRCDGFLPYELPLAADSGSLRTARVGSGAVPVGNEILVAYRLTGDDAASEPFSFPTSAAAHRPYPGSGAVPEVSAAALRLRAELQLELGMSLLEPGASGAPDLYRSHADPDFTIARLLADPRVLYAQRNYYLELQGVPNDPYLLDMQWNLTRFGLPEAWELYDGSQAESAVVLAVLDSGVYGAHPDLVDKLLSGWDFYGHDPDTEPGVPNSENDAAHGTHVAGIAAASGDDATGVAGVAYGAAVKIVPIKVFDDIGAGGTISGLIDAIRWAAGLPAAGVPANANKAAVINMSLGVPGRHPALDAAALDAWNAGAVLVAAAGNHNVQVPDRGVLSPGNAPCVIAVGSVDGDFGVSSFSNHGPQTELVAPGGYSTSGCTKVFSSVPPTPAGSGPDALYGCLAGTSMASPFVAGVAALLIGQGELSSPAEVRTRLSETAYLREGQVDHAYYGNGVVCADAALGAVTRCGVPPSVTATSGG